MERVPGGNYPADQNDDGTWNIRGVPIFAECELPMKGGGEFRFTRSWLENAIKMARSKETQESFMARVHVHHHDDGEPVMDAGYLRPTSVGELQIDGERKAVLFADLIRIPQEVYEQIRAFRLPYRSIEAVPQDGFIDSLALMPTKAPFHRLPMLSIGREAPVAGVTNPADGILEPQGATEGLVACFSRAHAVAALSHFPKGGNVPDQLLEKPAGVKAADEKSAPADDKQDKEVQAQGGGEGKSAVEELFGQERSLEEWKQILDAVKAKIAEFEAPAEDAAAAPQMPEEGPVEMASDKSTAITKDDSGAVKAEAELALVKGRLEKMEQEKALEEAVEAANKRLARFNIGSDPKGHLMAYARKHGLTRFAGYVEAIEEQAQPAPPASGFDFDLSNMPPEVAKFSDPAAQRIAFEAKRAYDALPASAKTMMTRDRFIELRVNSNTATEAK